MTQSNANVKNNLRSLAKLNVGVVYSLTLNRQLLVVTTKTITGLQYTEACASIQIHKRHTWWPVVLGSIHSG